MTTTSTKMQNGYIYIYIYIYIVSSIDNRTLQSATLWRQDLTLVSDTLQAEHSCSRVCLSKAELAFHMEYHDNKISKTCFTRVLQIDR